MKIATRFALFTIIIIAITSAPVNVYSCGPYFPEVVFMFHDKPDIPLQSFLRGDLGIVQPGFGSIYLFIAHRYLSGSDFTGDEQRFVGAVFQPDTAAGVDRLSSASADWMSARQRVPGTDPYTYFMTDAVFQDSRNNEYEFYENIHYDAFETAVNTLDTLISQFGAQNPYVVDWTRSQDMVFHAADSSKVPSPLGPGAPSIFYADRAYQIASAYFYMRNYAVAESLFASIAKDNSSPWQKTAEYLIARCMIRDATLLATNQDSILTLAEGYLTSLLRDPAMGEFYPSARRLLNFCEYRTEPPGSPRPFFEKLDRSINARRIGHTFSTDWSDYAGLLGQFADSSYEGESDFARWQSCYLGAEDSSAFARSYRNWQKTKSFAWLIAALSDASPTAPEVGRLLDAATVVSPHDPAYPTVTYWRIRLLIDRSQDDEALKLIDNLLTYKSVSNSISNTNLVLSERVRFVKNFSEFLRYCRQRPLAIKWDDEGDVTDYSDSTKDNQELFTQPATALNRYVPLTILDSACHSTILPPNLRAALLRATWTRSFLLGREDISLDLAPILANMTPELKPFLDQYDSAKGEGARRFTGAYILLKFPGLRPSVSIGLQRGDKLNEEDDYRDNWWYSGNLAVESSADAVYSFGYTAYQPENQDTIPPPAFLSKANLQEGKKEAKELYSLPVAATYLSGIVDSWAKTHPQDPRVPEALHQVIEVSRVGCSDSTSHKGEIEAFNMLHERYPNSEWTKKTKYWY